MSTSPRVPTPTSTTPPPLSPQVSSTPAQDSASQTLFSPDGSFVAKLYSEYVHPSGFQTIEVSTSAGELLWSIPYTDQPTMADPRPNLAIAGWSPDGASLYFYRSFAYDGALTLWNGLKLQALNVASGEIATLTPSEGLMAFAFSPDSSELAYVLDDDDPRVLYIRNLVTGELRDFTTSVPRHEAGEYVQAGSIRWSDSGNMLIVFTSRTDERAAMILFDLLHVSSRPLLEFWQDQYVIEDWSHDETIRLHDLFQGLIATVDTRTGQLTVVGTPTPSQ
jgi:WD40 repeat protein